MNDPLLHADPVADDWKIGRPGRVVPKAAADLDPAFGIAGDAIPSALLFDNARPPQREARFVRDLLFKETVPPIAFA
jgi:hypothetical protein